MKRILSLMLIVVSLFAFSNPASAATPESVFVNSINVQRSLKGLPALSIDAQLTSLAVGWSQTLAANGVLSHSDLTTGAPSNWKKLGENVGMGGTADSIAAALIASPKHYENIVDPDFTSVGVGITTSNDTLFVVEKFMQTTDVVFAKPIPTTSTPTTTIPLTTTIPPPPTTSAPPVTTTEPIAIAPVIPTPKVVSDPISKGSVFKRFFQSLKRLVLRFK